MGYKIFFCWLRWKWVRKLTPRTILFCDTKRYINTPKFKEENIEV